MNDVILIILFVTVISKQVEKWALKFWKPWICKDEKKTSTSAFAYCSKWFRNWIPFIHTSESQIQQLQVFFWKPLCNLKCDCQWIKIPFLFLENSFANVSNSILYVQKRKSFWLLHPPFEKKNEEWKVVCNYCIPLCPHSATYFNLKQKLLLTIFMCASTAKFSIKKYSKWNSI